MGHPVPSDFRGNDFHAAFFTDNAPVLHPLVLAAVALKILDRSKYLGTEQTVSFRLEGSVIDGFGFFHFPERPASNGFRRGHGYPDPLQVLTFDLGICFTAKDVKIVGHVFQAPLPIFFLFFSSDTRLTSSPRAINSLTSTLNDSGMAVVR